MSMLFEVGKTYNFETHVPTLLGAGYRGVTVVAIMDYGTAIKERDVTALHRTLYGSLPSGTPDDPAATNYLRLKMTTGDYIIMGYSWIKEDTIAMVESGQVSVQIFDTNPDDVTRIRDILVLAGFNSLNIEYVT